jgi:hypothetical protein
VFLTYEWHCAAWEWVQKNSQLNIVCIYCDSDLIGIVPLIKKQEKIRGLKLKKLQFLAVPDTQFCDIITTEQNAEQVANVTVDYLIKNKQEWDFLSFGNLSDNSYVYRLFIPLIHSKNFKSRLFMDTHNPQIIIDQSWEDYYKTRSRRLKKGNNLIANKLNKASDKIEIKHFGTRKEDAPTISQLLKDITDISCSSWKSQTGLSLDNPGPAAFIKYLTDCANNNGWLSIWLLYIGERPVAMEYHLRYDKYVHALRADFRDEHSDLSPGAYLHWKIVENLFKNKGTNYQMGPGNNAYKERWSNATPPVYRITVYSKNILGRFLGAIQTQIAPTILRFYSKLSPRRSNK